MHLLFIFTQTKFTFMKTLFIGFIFLLSTCFTHSQDSTKVIGLWQVKLNGKFLTGKDMGVTQAPYASQSIYYAISSDSWFLVMGASKSSITEKNIYNLVNQQMAMEGSYAIYSKIEDLPEEVQSKFEANKPYKDKSFFVEGEIAGERQSFCFEPLTGKFLGINKENQMELVRVAGF